MGWSQIPEHLLSRHQLKRMRRLARIVGAAHRAPEEEEEEDGRQQKSPTRLGALLIEQQRLRDRRNEAINQDISMIKKEIAELVSQRRQERQEQHDRQQQQELPPKAPPSSRQPVQIGGSAGSGGGPPVLPAKAPPLRPPKAPPPLMPPQAPPGQPPWQPLVPPPAWPAPGGQPRAPPHEAAPRAPLPPQLVLPQHIVNIMMRANRVIPVHGTWIGRSRFARFVLGNGVYRHWPATFQEGKRCERVIAYHGTTESGLEGILRCDMALPGPASRGWGDIISCVGFRVEHAEDTVAAAVAILDGFIPRYRKHQVCCIVEFLVIAEVRTFYSSREYHQSMAMDGRPDLCVCRFPRDHLGTKVMSIPAGLTVPSALILDTAFV